MGRQIHSHLESVSEAILGDLATSPNVKTVENAWEGLKKHTFHTTSVHHAFGVHFGSILEAIWEPKCSKMEAKRVQKGS